MGDAPNTVRRVPTKIFTGGEMAMISWFWPESPRRGFGFGTGVFFYFGGIWGKKESVKYVRYLRWEGEGRK